MGTLFGSLRDKILSKLLSSLLPKYALKYEGDVRRVVLGVNMLIAALYVALPLVPDAAEKKMGEELDYLNRRWKDLLGLANQYLKLDLSEKP